MKIAITVVSDFSHGVRIAKWIEKHLADSKYIPTIGRDGTIPPWEQSPMTRDKLRAISQARYKIEISQGAAGISRKRHVWHIRIDGDQLGNFYMMKKFLTGSIKLSGEGDDDDNVRHFSFNDAPEATPAFTFEVEEEEEGLVDEDAYKIDDLPDDCLATIMTFIGSPKDYYAIRGINTKTEECFTKPDNLWGAMNVLFVIGSGIPQRKKYGEKHEGIPTLDWTHEYKKIGTVYKFGHIIRMTISHDVYFVGGNRKATFYPTLDANGRLLEGYSQMPLYIMAKIIKSATSLRDFTRVGSIVPGNPCCFILLEREWKMCPKCGKDIVDQVDPMDYNFSSLIHPALIRCFSSGLRSFHLSTAMDEKWLGNMLTMLHRQCPKLSSLELHNRRGEFSNAKPIIEACHFNSVHLSNVVTIPNELIEIPQECQNLSFSGWWEREALLALSGNVKTLTLLRMIDDRTNEYESQLSSINLGERFPQLEHLTFEHDSDKNTTTYKTLTAIYLKFYRELPMLKTLRIRAENIVPDDNFFRFIPSKCKLILVHYEKDHFHPDPKLFVLLKKYQNVILQEIK